MATEASFFRAIEEDPDDLTHALVWADWLSDRGDDDRADFVRVGCQMAKLDPQWDVEHALLAARCDRLHNKHRDDEDGWGRWNGEYHYNGCIRMPRHGVPYAVRVTDMAEFLNDPMPALVPPLAALSVRFDREDDGRFFDLPQLARVRELFTDCLYDEQAVAMMRSPHLGRLRKLTVWRPQFEWQMHGKLYGAPLFDQLTDLSIARIDLRYNYLFARARPANLRRLSVKQTALTTDETNMLFSAQWAGLTELHFDEVVQLGRACDLIASEHLRSLEALTVRDNLYFGYDGAAAVLRNYALVNLRKLRLAKLDAESDPADLCDALARLDLPALRYLDLGQNVLSAAMLQALGRSPVAPRLHGLKLGGCQSLDKEGAIALAKGDFHSLRQLELGTTALTDKGLKKLLPALWMRNVAWLDLSGNNLKEAARALGKSPNVAGLRVLNLTGNDLGDSGVAEVVGSDHLAQLQALYLNETKLTDATIPALADAPMLENLVVLMLGQNDLSQEGPLALGASGRCTSMQSIRWDWEDIYFDDDAQQRVNDAFGPGCFRFREDEVMLEHDDPAYWW